MRHILVAVTMVALALAGGGASAADPQKLRLSSQLPGSAPLSKGLERWKAQVEQASGGRVAIELYNNSQLYKDNEVFPAVQSRSVDMGLVVSAQFVAVDPVFAIFDLPGLLTDYDAVSAALAGPLGATLTAHLHKLGVHPLYWPQQGFSAIATTKRALASPADFKRLKLRAHSRELARLFQLLGASPVVIAPSEVSTAISRGTIDGLSTSIASYYTRKWFESAPHINDSRFGVIGTVIIVNKALWDGLPDDLKAVFAAASRDAEAWSTQATIAEDADTLKGLAERSVQVIRFDDAARAALIKAAEPMYQEYAKSAGPDGAALLAALRPKP